MMNSSPQSGPPIPRRAPALDQMPLELNPLGLNADSFKTVGGMELDTMPLDIRYADKADPAVSLDGYEELPEPLGFAERMAQKEREEAELRKAEEEGPVHLPELEARTKPKSVYDCLGVQPRKRLPLSKVGQGDESPSFYLSLSDLMSLLLVFFVLIFSMSELSIGTRNDVPKKPVAQAGREDVQPASQSAGNPGGGAVSKPMVKASARPVDLSGHGQPTAPKGLKTTGGPMDLPRMGGLPGMSRGNGPVNLGLVVATFDAPAGPKSGVREPRKEQPKLQEVRGLAVDRSLLAMVTMSKPAPKMGLPEQSKKEEPKPAVNQQLGSLQRDIQQALSQGMELTAAPDRLIISLPESITFAIGQAEIKRSMHKRLALLAVKLNLHAGYQVVITGHTDNIPISNQRFASNWELSAARAAAVGRSLLAQGVARRRITIKGMADTRPRVSNSSELNRKKNRRVEIELHPV